MTGIAVFCFFIGTLIGMSIIPIIYGVRYLRKHKTKYGFREYSPVIMETDPTILKSKQEEHSAKDYH